MTFTRQVGRFSADLFMARAHHKAIHSSDVVDDARAMEQRMALGRKADELRGTYHELEAAIREDVQP
jgi:hypothetical protein